VVLKFPNQHLEIIELLHDLIDPVTNEVWLTDSDPLNTFDGWWNWLDDLFPANKPYERIGSSLRDKREARAVAAFLDERASLYAELGDVGYAAYRSHKRWPKVVQAAANAIAVLDPDGQTRAKHHLN
jgi:hypothetical protein